MSRFKVGDNCYIPISGIEGIAGEYLSRVKIVFIDEEKHPLCELSSCYENWEEMPISKFIGDLRLLYKTKESAIDSMIKRLEEIKEKSE